LTSAAGPLRWALPAAALAMPLVGALFGGDVGAQSARFRTLVVPAGYAFAIWGLIFLLDALFAAWQALRARAHDPGLQRLRLPATLGFACTALWMPVFVQQAYAAAVVVIWLALALLLAALLAVARAGAGSAAASPLAAVALGLHAGWLSLAAFVNTAQLALASGWTTPTAQLPLSLLLWAGAAALLLLVQRALGPCRLALLAYTAAAAWGLVGVVLAQHGSPLPGADTSAQVATALLVLLAAHAAWRTAGRGLRA
jgi:hypothetical protein